MDLTLTSSHPSHLAERRSARNAGSHELQPPVRSGSFCESFWTDRMPITATSSLWRELGHSWSSFLRLSLSEHLLSIEWNFVHIPKEWLYFIRSCAFLWATCPFLGPHCNGRAPPATFRMAPAGKPVFPCSEPCGPT